ncbi:MAG: hypothetical protein Q4G52_09870 [Clostridia bacterium]|nr:hypothetical protein [Clostridia bacterium]
MILLLFCPAALAEETADIAMPEQVREDIDARWAGYTIESYIELAGAPEGDYGFALLHRGDTRVLAGYREENGGMSCWLESKGAVPQGETEGGMWMYPEGETYTVWDENGERSVLSDGLAFSVYTLDEIGEAYDGIVQYQGQDGVFRLTQYTDGVVNTVVPWNGELQFHSNSVGYMGKLKGEVETDIRFVDLDALPKTMGEAWKRLGGAPELPGVFAAQTVAFEKGRKYPVYTGPGEAYARSGGGKATVSTNDWIEVFGQARGWIMIQYAVNDQRCRVGWIEASALPDGARVKSMDGVFAEAFEGTGSVGTLTENCELTDDPFISGATIASLPKGTAVRLILCDDVWAYIGVEAEGRTMLGFVPEFYVAR